MGRHLRGTLSFRRSVLFRSRLFKILTLVIFLTQMANEATQTLLMYYLTDPPLCFTDTDLAGLFVVLGVTSILAQAGLLRPLIRIFGEVRNNLRRNRSAECSATFAPNLASLTDPLVAEETADVL